MIHVEVIIVGGGPAGSSCAWKLVQNNIDCLILDQQQFPRFKPCAGWITPAVIHDLNINVAEYPHSFTTFRSFHISVYGIPFILPARQHAIRRYEFDEWLLRRSGAPIHTHSVKTITQTGGEYVIDDEFACKVLVGAGGTHCPVYRIFFSQDSPRRKESLIVAQEEEFPYPYTDPRCRLWFLEDRLPGYAWYVPKANGYVNVGVGGVSEQLKSNGDTLKFHWNLLVEKLERMKLVQGHSYKPSGHSYYTRLRLPELRKDNALIVGDAAGLATLDMGEGISPGIKSGLLAAEAILHNTGYNVDSIPKYSASALLRMGM